MKKIKKIMITLVCVVLFVSFVSMVYAKVIQINPLFINEKYVRGVDISHYQGKVDMDKLKEQGIQLVYMKATEGSQSVDDKFAINWKNGIQSGLYVGAYHFFSFDSPGKTQAQNFMDVVGDLHGRMIPVVDVEFYGNKEENPPEVSNVQRELNDFLQTLEARYGVKPMIYTTQKIYAQYLGKEYEAYPLWIRSVYYPANLAVGNKWLMWQYSDSAELAGYHGTERCIDLDLFHGEEEELKTYLCP